MGQQTSEVLVLSNPGGVTVTGSPASFGRGFSPYIGPHQEAQEDLRTLQTLGSVSVGETAAGSFGISPLPCGLSAFCFHFMHHGFVVRLLESRLATHCLCGLGQDT